MMKVTFDGVSRTGDGAARAELRFGIKKVFFVIAVLATCTYICFNFLTYGLHAGMYRQTGYIRKYQHYAPFGDQKSIAICMGISFRGPAIVGIMNNMSKTEMFSAFLPSFCKTVSKGYSYHFYIAFDFDDPFLSNETCYQLFNKTFTDIIRGNCTYQRNISLQLLTLPDSGKPAWAQNAACMKAYIDGAEYFYRVNDDTKFTSSGWTEHFIQKLGNYSPPNVGVVGPTFYTGNTEILTYEFTHRTHIDIFGVYYPHTYRAQYADDWITYIYLPNRTTKLGNVTISHTQAYGRRYQLYDENRQTFKDVEDKSRILIHRYIQYKASNRSRLVPDGKKVVSMSLYGNDKTYTYGAIRNAQLLPILFPEWTLRVYIAVPGSPLAVPDKIIRTLVRLNVDVREINPFSTNIPPGMWRLLVADDPDIEFFLIRDADGRLSERDYDITQRLIEQDKPFLCVRDHVTHCNCTVPKGLWGGKSQWFQALNLKKTVLTLLETSELTEKYFLEKALGNWFNREQCEKLVECEGAPTKSNEHSLENYTYIGNLYDEFGEIKQPYNRCV